MTQEAKTSFIAGTLLSAQNAEIRPVVFHLCLHHLQDWYRYWKPGHYPPYATEREYLSSCWARTCTHAEQFQLCLVLRMSSWQLPKAFTTPKSIANCAASIPLLSSKKWQTGMNFGHIPCDIHSTEDIQEIVAQRTEKGANTRRFGKKVISKQRKGSLSLWSGQSYNLSAVPRLGINKTNPSISLTVIRGC